MTRFTPRPALLLAALAACDLSPRPAGAGEPPETVVTALGARMDEALQRATAGGFWGAVLVARGDEVLLRKGYGALDYGPRPNGPDTLFELASASKHVTAAALLRLEEQGRLDLDHPLERFFKGLPRDKRPITVRQLLTHTSGLSPDTGVPYASTIGRDEFVRAVLAPPLVAPPGTRFAYANAGYALAAAVVEVASRKAFEAYCAKELFERAGLADTGFIGDPRLVASERASRRLTEDGGDWSAARWHRGWGYRGMGGVVTTLEDLHRWDRALRTDRVLGAKARARFHEPALEGYALGWLVETTDRGTRKAHHSGSVAGYAVRLSRWLEEDAVVAILSNGRTDLGAVERAIEGLLFTPASLVAEIDVSGYELTSHLAAEFPGDLAWEVRAEKGAVRVGLRHGDRTVATLTLPPGAVLRLAAELDRVLGPRGSEGFTDPAAMEGGVYLAAYGAASRRLRLGEDAVVYVLPRYEGVSPEGTSIVDPRPLFVLEDRLRGQWPLLVKMNLAAARAFLAALRGVAPATAGR